MEHTGASTARHAWVLQYAVAESHETPVYGVAFAPISCTSHSNLIAAVDNKIGEEPASVRSDKGSEKLYLLATCGGPGIRLYSAPTGSCSSQDLQLLVSFASSTGSPASEQCYCCAWTVEEETGEALLCLGYENGIIRVIRLSDDSVKHTLLGHSGAVNCLSVSPQRASWLLSASKDESLRLWDVTTGHCFAIFCGLQGHRGEVLFCDWHSSGERILSCGMDCTVREWSIETAIVDAFDKQRLEYQVERQMREDGQHRDFTPKNRRHRPLQTKNATPQRVLFHSSRLGKETPAAALHISENNRDAKGSPGDLQEKSKFSRGRSSKGARSAQTHQHQEIRDNLVASIRSTQPLDALPDGEQRASQTAAHGRPPLRGANPKDNELFEEPAVPTNRARTQSAAEDNALSLRAKLMRSRARFLQFPDHVFRLVHGNYVDCVMYIGDLILSKSVHNKIVLWAPGTDTSGLLPSSTEHHVIVEYRYPAGDLWYMRFALNHARTLLAVGSRDGRIHIFDIDDPQGTPVACLAHPQAKSPVRHLAFSPDGKILVAVCDDSTVWRWDREP